MRCGAPKHQVERPQRRLLGHVVLHAVGALAGHLTVVARVLATEGRHEDVELVVEKLADDLLRSFLAGGRREGDEGSRRVLPENANPEVGSIVFDGLSDGGRSVDVAGENAIPIMRWARHPSSLDGATLPGT